MTNRKVFASGNDTCIACHSTHGQPGISESGASADTRVGELGVACESCHGPAEEHIRYHSNPLTRYASRLGRKSDESMTNPVKLDSKRSSELCGQCHSISSPPDRAEWNKHGFSFRAGDDLHAERYVLRHPARITQPQNQGMSREFLDKYFWPDGMVRVSGREYNGLIESPCYQRGEMSCVSCHSMHGGDRADQLKPKLTGNQACIQCHAEIEKDLTAHTHHAADSTGSQWLQLPHATHDLWTGQGDSQSRNQ